MALFKRASAIAAIALAGSLAAASTGHAGILYSNGFETDIAGWDNFGGAFNATRVASGTNGIASASGAFHAESSASGSAGNWGGYNTSANGAGPYTFREYTTSVDIYLDVDAGFANDTRFDFTSAINNSAGGHRRDFAFNGGFYDSSDATGPGAGTDRFIFSASNNTGRANSFPKNPGRDPFAIDSTGWYTFQHHFYDDGGVLAVELSIFDDTMTELNSWTLSDASDLIGGIGGNRYGWFASNELRTLAFDNAFLSVVDEVPEPATLTLLGLGLAGMAARRRRRV